MSLFLFSLSVCLFLCFYTCLYIRSLHLCFYAFDPEHKTHQTVLSKSKYFIGICTQHYFYRARLNKLYSTNELLLSFSSFSFFILLTHLMTSVCTFQLICSVCMFLYVFVFLQERESVCVCVCVCVFL